jgi:hypothetical protein
VGPAVDERGRGEGVPVRGSFLGRGLVSVLGRIGSPWPSSIFIFFSSFLFMFSYLLHITFIFEFQFDSN